MFYSAVRRIVVSLPRNAGFRCALYLRKVVLACMADSLSQAEII